MKPLNLKIIEWNIKGESSFGWHSNYTISQNITVEIIKHNADVIVLTAFVVTTGIEYLFTKLKENGYIWFINAQSGKNGILIAIKEHHVDIVNFIKTEYSKKPGIVSNLNGINILKVSLPFKCNTNLTVIGCRMEVDLNRKKPEELKKSYDSLKKCFYSNLIPLVNEVDKNNICIVCGDFNNASCRGDLNKKYNPADYTDKVHINYNLNIIKDQFNELGFQMADIIQTNNIGTPIPTFHKYKTPLDHIFYKNIDISKCYPIETNLSDHNILFAEFESSALLAD